MDLIIETKSHYEVICVLNYVNSTYNTMYTQHDFGGSRVKFVYIESNGNVSYIRTFKSAAKLGKVIHTFPMFVNKVIAENNRLQLQIENLHKDLKDAYEQLQIMELKQEQNMTKLKTIFKL